MQLLSNLLHSLGHVERSANRLNSRVQLSLSALEDRVQPSTSPVNLGAAGDYAVLALQRTQIDTDWSTITGNVGISQRAGLWLDSHSSVAGNVTEFSNNQVHGRGTVSGSVTTSADLLRKADHDALEASSVASRLKATQSFRRIDRVTTVTGNGGLNVISVRGDVTASLTLSGSANDVFIVNIQGDLRLRGRESVQLAGGATADHVILNFTGRWGIVSAQNGVVNGTVLAPRYGVHLHGSSVKGEIISGGEIEIDQHSQVNFVGFDNGQNNPPPPPPVVGATLSGLVWQDKPSNPNDPTSFNGVYDPGEELSDVVMNLSDGVNPDFIAVTGKDGTYSFTGVGAGTYTLSAQNFVPGSGLVTIGSAGGTLDSGTVVGITLANDTQATGYVFGFFAGT